MALYLVGENLDKTRSHYMAEKGKIIQLMRGIYADFDDDIDATVLKHAVRIARYLYPRAYISAASAISLGPTQEGRLFLSARRNQRTRIRALEIIQNQAPIHPSVAEAIVNDGMGEFRVMVSSIRQRFLEAFRVRSEHASSINDEMKAVMAARLVEEYGNPNAAADALWALARENEWLREGQAAERYLRHLSNDAPALNEAVLNLVVAWHGTPLGHLVHDGFEWRWRPTSEEGPPIIRQTTPGKLPPFISSLLPEGWLEQVLEDIDERALLKSGKRYLSNITIVEHELELSTLPQDVLINHLEGFISDGAFTGKYAGPGRGEIEEGFERNLAKIYSRADTPRLSGVQIKAPMYLDGNGVLLPATGLPFTHILKPAGTSGYEALPLIEWVAMALGRAAGFEVPASALVPMPDKLPLALVVERFDIRQDYSDSRMFALEDMCSVLDLPATAKYDGTIERVVRAVRPLSTAPEEDVLMVIKRAFFAWLIADGDMHLKNMGLLKIQVPGKNGFRSVRVAPLYDAVTTRVFPNLRHDRMALKLGGKDNRLDRADFRRLAATAGIAVTVLDKCLDDVLQGIKKEIDVVALPKGVTVGIEGEKLVDEMLGICRARINVFA